MRTLTIILIALFLVGGLIIFDFTRAVNAAQNLRVEGVQLRDLDVDIGWRFKIGIPPVEPYIKRVGLKLLMTLSNPTDYPLRVRGLQYVLHINGRQVATGRMGDVYVPPGRRTVTVPLDVDPKEAAAAVLAAVSSAVRRGTTGLSFSYDVEGRARVPITVLGMEVPGAQLTVPFRKEGVYRLSFHLPSVQAPTPQPQPAPSAPPVVTETATRGRLVVERYGWFVGGSPVHSAMPGQTVRAAILVRAVGRVGGTVTLEVRRDLRFMPDTTLTSRYFPLELGDGESRTLYLDFTAEGGKSLRGYFMRVYFNGRLIWEMGDGYPPRLAVTVKAATSQSGWRGTGSLVVERYAWLQGNQVIYAASSGSQVTAAIVVSARGGNVDGTVTLEVRKDLRFRPDETAVVRNFRIRLGDGESRTLMVSFLVDRGITLRGYYMKVYFNGRLIWEMGDGYPPRLRVGS